MDSGGSPTTSKTEKAKRDAQLDKTAKRLQDLEKKNKELEKQLKSTQDIAAMGDDEKEECIIPKGKHQGNCVGHSSVSGSGCREWHCSGGG